MGFIGRVLSGVVVLAIVWIGIGVYNGDVDLSGLDPRRLFTPDYTTMQAMSDCDPADYAGGTFGDEYGECLRAHEAEWEKAQRVVHERGFNDGRKQSCDALRGRYVAPDALAEGRDAYESPKLRSIYMDGYNEGSVSVFVVGNC